MIKQGLLNTEKSKAENLQLKDEKEQNVQNLLTEITVELHCKRSLNECAAKIAELKKNNEMNITKIGSILLQFKDAYSTEKSGKNLYKTLIKNNQVEFRRTQAEKYIKVYKFCVKCIKTCQSTDMFNKLGIEKISLILTLKDEDIQITLGQAVVEKELSVKQLKYAILLLNNGISSSVTEVCTEAINAQKENRLKEELQKFSKSQNKQDKYNLEQANKLLTDENHNLKEKIKALELQVSKLQNKEISIQNNE